MKLQLFFKSHVKTYTRKDGTVVQAHDDKRQKKDWRDEENWHTRTMAKMKTHSDDELRFIHKDATEAAELGEKMGSKKAGQYRDEAHYAAMELHARSKAKASKPSTAAFDEHKEKALDEAVRWANKEQDQYGTAWMRDNLASYLAERWGIPKSHAQKAVDERFA